MYLPTKTETGQRSGQSLSVFMGEYIFLVLFASVQFVLHQLDQTIYLKKQTNGTFECTVALDWD